MNDLSSVFVCAAKSDDFSVLGVEKEKKKKVTAVRYYVKKTGAEASIFVNTA